MSKIICDICGTTYPETASHCPICGCAKAGAAQTTAGRTGGEDVFRQPLLQPRQLAQAVAVSRKRSRRKIITGLW